MKVTSTSTYQGVANHNKLYFRRELSGFRASFCNRMIRKTPEWPDQVDPVLIDKGHRTPDPCSCFCPGTLETFYSKNKKKKNQI